MSYKCDNDIISALHIKGMNQGQLSKKVGVRREYINRIANKKVQPTIGLALKIADALDVEARKLFHSCERT